MIRQPDFVTIDVFNWAKKELNSKKSNLDVDKAKFMTFQEGLCVQMMHLGPYSEESRSIEMMKRFMGDNNLVDDIGIARKHHEIYLSDPRKVEPHKIKTILRHPVKVR